MVPDKKVGVGNELVFGKKQLEAGLLASRII